MGFLDKLFGRAKDTVSDLTHRGDDAAADTAEPGPDTTGSNPPAA